MKQQDPVIRFIETEGYHHVKAALSGTKFIEYEPGRLTVGAGTGYETVFRRGPDGIISASDPARLNTRLNARKSIESVFAHAWGSITHQAELMLIQQAQLRIWEPKQERGFRIAFHEADPEGWERAMKEQKRHQAASRTARHIAAGLGNGYVRQPVAFGSHYLKLLAGREQAAQVCRIAGRAATLNQLNTLIRHREPIEAAYQESPNAATLWLALRGEQHEPESPPLTAAGIIGESREILMQEFRGKNPDPAIWDSFLNLNHLFIRQEMPDLREAARAAAELKDTDIVPSYSALKSLRRLPGFCRDNREGAPLRAYLRLSAKPGISQSRLSSYQVTAAIMEQSYQDRDPVSEEEWIPRIESIMAVAEPDEKPARRRRRRTESPAAAAADGKEARSRQKQARLEAMIPELERLCDGAVQVVVSPADGTIEARVRGGHGDKPALSLRRAPDGRIRAAGELCPEGLIQLPSPENEGAEAGMPTVLGSFQYYALEAAAGLAGTRDARQLSNLALRRWEQSESEFGRNNLDRHHNRRIRQALLALIDPEPARLCQELSGGLSLRNYNAAVLWRRALPDLARTNPGIAALALLSAQDDGGDPEPVNHPGQLVEAVKREINGNGNGRLSPAEWKFLAQLPPESVCAAHNRPDHGREEDALRALRTISRAGADPGPAGIAELLRFDAWHMIYLPFFKKHDEQSLRIQEAMERVARLLCAHLAGGGNSPTENEKHDLADYVRQTAMAGEPLSAKTLKGALKASRRWHQEQNRRNAQKDWSERLAERKGRYRLWNCLVGEQEVAGYRFLPLTDEKALFWEGKEMRHCVGSEGHTADCAEGRSRIFSVNQNGRHLGTTRLSAVGQAWLEQETRTAHNGAPKNGMKEAAQHLARIYTKAQGRAPADWNRSWSRQEAAAHADGDTPPQPTKTPRERTGNGAE